MKTAVLLVLMLTGCGALSGCSAPTRGVARANAVTDPLAVVLEDIRDRVGTPDSVRVVLVEAVATQGATEQPRPFHSPEVLGRLQALGLAQGTCVDQGCNTSDGSVVVALGRVLQLPENNRVRILDNHPSGVPLDVALAAIPDSLAVPAQAAVDVVVTTPCPAAQRSFRCRVPDTVRFRYFLRAGASGDYSVLTRYMTGAI